VTDGGIQGPNHEPVAISETPFADLAFTAARADAPPLYLRHSAILR
jgi:hypothetical protein